MTARQVGKDRVEQRDCADRADHHGGEPQRQAELRAHQAAHQRVADLGLLLNLHPGAHHAGAAPMREHDAFPLRLFAASHPGPQVAHRVADHPVAQFAGLTAADRQFDRG